MLWVCHVYGHCKYFSSFSAEIDFTHQILASEVDPRAERVNKQTLPQRGEIAKHTNASAIMNATSDATIDAKITPTRRPTLIPTRPVRRDKPARQKCNSFENHRVVGLITIAKSTRFEIHVRSSCLHQTICRHTNNQ